MSEERVDKEALHPIRKVNKEYLYKYLLVY